MKKVLLLGDSIRMGYQSEVKKLLENEYEVMYPEDNGRFAAYTLWQVNQAFKWTPDIALFPGWSWPPGDALQSRWSAGRPRSAAPGC